MARLETERKQLEDQIQEQGQTREMVDVKVRQEMERETQIEAEVHYKKERQTALRTEIEEMEGQSEQHLAVFGNKIPLVDKRIKATLRQFKVS